MRIRGWDAIGNPRRAGSVLVTVIAALVAAVVVFVLLSACSDLHIEDLPTVGSDPGDPVVATPSLRNDIQPIFTARCAIAGCHITPTQANLGLVLTDAATSYAQIVNVESVEVAGILRVVPGDSANSYLQVKVDFGDMPKGGPKLSQGTLDTIRNWIDQGAQDN